MTILLLGEKCKIWQNKRLGVDRPGECRARVPRGNTLSGSTAREIGKPGKEIEELIGVR